MRISDWSSDVCSSDLIGPCPRRVPRHYRRRASRGAARIKKASRPLRANARDREAGNAWAASPPRPATPDRAILALVRFDIVDRVLDGGDLFRRIVRSEEHTSELQSLMRISYAVFCLKK